jgi:glycosyltransferase involved in cell wall biosynthesis
MKLNSTICSGISENCMSCQNMRIGIDPNENIVQKMKGRQMIVASEFLRQKHIESGFEPENIEMIEYGLNPAFFKPHYGGDGGEILNITRIAYEKGIDLYYDLAKMNPELKWLLAGYPKHNFSDNSVDYMGEITEMDKMYKLKSCEIFVSTPRWNEPVGGTYLEAKACGKPIITFRLGGIPQYHEGIGSVLLDYCDLKGMNEAIKKLHADEDLRIKLGKEGRKQIEERNNENILIHKNLAIYDKVRGVR